MRELPGAACARDVLVHLLHILCQGMHALAALHTLRPVAHIGGERGADEVRPPCDRVHRLLDHTAGARPVAHRYDEMAIVDLSSLGLEHMLVEANKVAQLVPITACGRLLEAGEVEHVSHKGVVLAAQLVDEQILQATHDAVDGLRSDKIHREGEKNHTERV
jgi:hypothetical protein